MQIKIPGIGNKESVNVKDICEKKESGRQEGTGTLKSCALDVKCICSNERRTE
jgi:hypothetical protein